MNIIEMKKMIAYLTLLYSNAAARCLTPSFPILLFERLSCVNVCIKYKDEYDRNEENNSFAPFVVLRPLLQREPPVFCVLKK